jgi:hypothetical protein
MIRSHWLSIIQQDSQSLAQIYYWYWLGISVCYTEPVVVMWIIVCYDEAVVLKHRVLCWASDCESCCIMLSQWLRIMEFYAEVVVVKHCVLCETVCAMLSQWLRRYAKADSVSVSWKRCLPSTSIGLFMSWRRLHGNGGSVAARFTVTGSA